MEERYSKFLEELTALSKKHKIWIDCYFRPYNYAEQILIAEEDLANNNFKDEDEEEDDDMKEFYENVKLPIVYKLLERNRLSFINDEKM